MLIIRDKVIVSTKACGPSGQMTWIRGGPAKVDAANITQAIDGSLKRLETDYIDLYQIHWPDRWMQLENIQHVAVMQSHYDQNMR